MGQGPSILRFYPRRNDTFELTDYRAIRQHRERSVILAAKLHVVKLYLGFLRIYELGTFFTRCYGYDLQMNRVPKRTKLDLKHLCRPIYREIT